MIDPSDVEIFTYKGTEHNVWHSDKNDYKWRFVVNRSNAQAKCDGWFSIKDLRDLADYMENHTLSKIDPNLVYPGKDPDFVFPTE